MKFKTLKTRIARSAINKKLASVQNDKNLIDWGTAKPTAKLPTTQKYLIEFLIFADIATPTELLEMREAELNGKASEPYAIRTAIRAFRDTYVMGLCKGCLEIMNPPANMGEVKVCPKCGGDSLAPKSRTLYPTYIESFFTNVMGPRGKVLGKGELNKESDDTVRQKYAVTLETIDDLARVADTKEKAFLFINAQMGMDSADIQTYYLTSQDVEILENPEKDVWVLHHKPRRKETGRGGKAYKNALCGEGLDAYRAYYRKENLRVGSPFMKGKQGAPLESQMMTLYLRNLKQKSGLVVEDMRLDLKTLRAFAFTALSSAEGVFCQGSDFGKFCTGKKVDASIHTYLLAHDKEIEVGYRSIMHKLNPSMAKYQETLDLKDTVAEMGEELIKMKGQLENMQGQITALANGQPGLAQEFKEVLDNPLNSLCDQKGCEFRGEPLVKGPDGLLTCRSTLKEPQAGGGGGRTAHITMYPPGSL